MGIHLLTTFYDEANPRRRMEYEFCLQQNAMAVDGLYVLSEGVPPPDWAPRNLRWRTISRRQTYNDLLDWSREVALLEDIVIIANCDMILPALALGQMEAGITRRAAWCLSRWELDSLQLYDHPWTQDVWAWRGPPLLQLRAGHRFGVPGCDNKFCWSLDLSGYELANPSRDVRTFHLHGTRHRTATNVESERVSPPYVYVTPHHLGERSKLRRVQQLMGRRERRLGRRSRRRLAR